MEQHPIWLPLAEQASKEMDPTKLSHLVQELCAALDTEREDRSTQRLAPTKQIAMILS
jgi:hypothetical protein